MTSAIENPKRATVMTDAEPPMRASRETDAARTRSR